MYISACMHTCKYVCVCHRKREKREYVQAGWWWMAGLAVSIPSEAHQPVSGWSSHYTHNTLARTAGLSLSLSLSPSHAHIQHTQPMLLSKKAAVRAVLFNRTHLITDSTDSNSSDMLSFGENTFNKQLQ